MPRFSISNELNENKYKYVFEPIDETFHNQNVISTHCNYLIGTPKITSQNNYFLFLHIKFYKKQVSKCIKKRDARAKFNLLFFFFPGCYLKRDKTNRRSPSNNRHPR